MVPAPRGAARAAGQFAFVIKGDETVEMRPVKVGPIEQGEALIDDGLHAGERVVVDGQYKLQPGSQVEMAEASGKPQTTPGREARRKAPPRSRQTANREHLRALHQAGPSPRRCSWPACS